MAETGFHSIDLNTYESIYSKEEPWIFMPSLLYLVASNLKNDNLANRIFNSLSAKNNLNFLNTEYMKVGLATLFVVISQ